MNTEEASHRLSKWQPEETIEGEHGKVGAFSNLKSQIGAFALTVKGVTIFTITDDPRIKPSSLGSATEIEMAKQSCKKAINGG